jgi:hypothetical protein
MLKRAEKWMCQPECAVYAAGCGGVATIKGCIDWRVKAVVAAVSPIEDICRLDPVG